MPSCCIPGCKSNGHQNRGEISLFKFTKLPKRRNVWFDVIEKETGVKFEEKNFNCEKRICNLHFIEDDMTVRIDETGLCKRFLNKEAIPSIFQRFNPIDKNKFCPTSPSQIQRVCRICLKKLPTSIENYPIDEELPSISLTIIDALSDVIGIELNTSTTYPSQACAMCHSHILTAYNLKYRVIQTEQSLKKLNREMRQTKSSNMSVTSRLKEIDSNSSAKRVSKMNSKKSPTIEGFDNNLMSDLLARIKRGKPHTQTRDMKDEFEQVEVKEENRMDFEEQYETQVKIEHDDEENGRNEDGEEPTYIFEALEMNSNTAGETTFLVEQPSSSPEVSFMENDEQTIELSSESEEEEIIERLKIKKSYKSPRKSVERKYEEWPEEIIKKRQKNTSKICKKCNYEAPTVLDLHRHIDHSTENCLDCYEPKVKCYICDRKFLLQVEKLRHVKRDHAGTIVRECGICEKPLRETAMSYENHMRSHYEPPNFLCVLCGKGYYKANHLHKHKRDVHDDNYWHICDICGLKSKAKILLAVHMRKHTKERPVMCDICSKSLFSTICLLKHKFTVHKTTQRRVFRCEKCDYCFLYKTEFERHIISCDGGTRNPKCYARIRYMDLISARKVVSRMN